MNENLVQCVLLRRPEYLQEKLGFELVERMRFSKSKYDRVVLTTLGSRVLGYLELYLHLRREQVQIPLQI